jgi:hypothetical protein
MGHFKVREKKNFLGFSQIFCHGSLEAILGLMKMTPKTETGDE